MPTAEELLEAIAAVRREFRREVADLRNEIQQSRRPTLRGDDRERLARILPALSGVFGDNWLTTRVVFEHDAPGLQIALAGIGRRAFGKLMARAEGEAITGYVVERAGHDGGAALFRIRGVS